MLANLQTNVTQGTDNITLSYHVTITAQRCFAVCESLALRAIGDIRSWLEEPLRCTALSGVQNKAPRALDHEPWGTVLDLEHRQREFHEVTRESLLRQDDDRTAGPVDEQY